MSRVKKKLQSRRGASITFALLIFLVCAVVSVAVVVAGSAAAGRMSQRAETDQRYYAVTSAAELLCDDFKDMNVTAVYDKASSATNVKTDAITVTEVKKTGASDEITSGVDVLKAVSKTLVSKVANRAASPTAPDDTLTLTVSSGAPENSALGCTIREYIYTDGRVVFEISNTTDPADTSAPVYTLQATFDANITESVTQYQLTSGETEVPMQRVTTKLVWSLNSIKKGKVGTE